MEKDINNLLDTYYKRRRGIEKSWSYIYQGSVDKRVKNLTNKFNKLIEEHYNTLMWFDKLKSGL